MSESIVAPITLKCTLKGKPYDHVVAGWANGLFGLDFRVFDDNENEYATPGFVITHLPTGYVVRQLVGVGTSQAKILADEILAGADWNFEGKPSAEHNSAVKSVMELHPGIVIGGLAFLSPAV